MNERERDRLALLSRVLEGQMTLRDVSARLGLSYRQCKRLLRRYRAGGDAGLVHGLRGRPGNNRRPADARRQLALSLYAGHYAGWGPTLAAEVLADRHGLEVDHETLRGWLIGSGQWTVRRDKARHHRRWRERKACLGELVQLDGSEHAWFGEGQPRCVLMVMVDDATGLTWAEFHSAETTQAAMSVFGGWVRQYGLPAGLYPDRHGIYRRNDKEADEVFEHTGRRPATQFGRAMAELGVELRCAHSPQAKGRVERMNGVLQDRLVKLMAMQGITTMSAANGYLCEVYLPDHNARFAVAPRSKDDGHRPAPPEEVMGQVLCLKHQRTVGNDGCVRFEGRWLQLAARGPRSRRVALHEHLDGRLEVWSKGQVLGHTELPRRPVRAVAKPTLPQRVAQHAEPWKPARKHPWQAPINPQAAAAAGRLRSSRTRCARPPCATAASSGKGTVLSR